MRQIAFEEMVSWYRV